MAGGKFDFTDDGDTFGFELKHQRGVFRNSGTFDDFIGIEDELRSVTAFLPRQVPSVEQGFVFFFYPAHVGNENFMTFFCARMAAPTPLSAAPKMTVLMFAVWRGREEVIPYGFIVFSE